MEHSIWGCDGTEQLINEGKDQERYGHVEQPAYPGVGRLGSHAESGLHGRPARARRERYVALAVCHPVVALPLLRCYQEGLASGTLRGVRSWAAAVQYCQKEDSRDSGPWEYGNRPTGGFGKAQAEDWDTWYTLASEGRFKRFPPKFKLSTWATWNASTARTSSSSTKRMCVECGFGVSPVSVRATLPARCSELRVLPKLNNKWWDGYQSQKVVIMEDVDKETIKFLHHHLKIWSDRWGFIGETKGGAVAPSHRWLVVTSNYNIADILADLEDRELRTAIMRRFTRFEMLSRDEIKAWDGDYQVHPPEAVAAMFK